MDFIHRVVIQDQEAKIIDEKLKTWTDQLTKRPLTNHTRTNNKPQSNKPGHTHT